MNKDSILLKVEEVAKKIFENEKITFTFLTTAEDIDEWDSFAHISLIMEIEKSFSINFALGELQDLKNVGELVELIEKKIDAIK